MFDPLLQTKLYIPRARPDRVSRPRLLEKLELKPQTKLILVSAPAGYGKTTLVSEWIDNLRFTSTDLRLDAAKERQIVNRQPVQSEAEVPKSQNRVAWLSLDEADNDLTRFWQYVIATLQKGLPDAALGADFLRSSSLLQPASPENMLAGLINELTAVATPITLVLDDYHVIEAQAVHESLAFLLDYMPPNLHLVIASRTSPPLPLARLRVRHQLTELTAADLRFTLPETAVFLNQIMGLNISPEALAALEERTEGWIAALQVVALSLPGRKNVAKFIQQFSGSHRHILDYLAEEVLAQQPPDLQKFLLYTSILDQFCAPLCDAVVRNEPLSTALLERLDQASLFLIPLDDERRWYRYHNLFADFLRGHLQKLEPAIIPELHQRASLWFEANGYWETAVNHTLAAQSYDHARRLIQKYARQQPVADIGRTLFRWLEQLPAEMVRAEPGLSLALAWGYCRSGQYQASEMWLEAVEAHQAAGEEAPSGTPQALQGDVAAVRSIIACYQGDVSAALAQSRTALTLLPPDNHILRGLIANNIAMNLGDALSASGDLAAAAQIYTEVAAAGQTTQDAQVTAFALNRLAQLQISQGALHQAAGTCQQVLALPLGSAERPSLEESLAHFNLAAVLYQWNRLDEAAQHTAAAEAGQESRENDWLAQEYILHIFLAQAQGDEAGARAALDRAAAIAQKTNITWIVSGVAAVKARLALMQGDLAAAGRWADTCGLAVGDDIGVHRTGEYATLARIHLARREIEPALALLDWLLSFVTRLELAGEVLELLLLKSLTHQAKGEFEKAMANLEEALQLAEPEGYVRIFVDEGEAMRLLLRRAATAGIMPGYIGRLLAAFPGASSTRKPQPLIDPLSDRELEVLRLLADGRTNPEIAAELFLAVGTVKRHVHNILGKLNVTNRREAVRRAKELELL